MIDSRDVIEQLALPDSQPDIDIFNISNGIYIDKILASPFSFAHNHVP